MSAPCTRYSINSFVDDANWSQYLTLISAQIKCLLASPKILELDIIEDELLIVDDGQHVKQYVVGFTETMNSFPLLRK